MKAPPFLLSVSLLVWGWQTGMAPLALMLALALELHRVLSWRWELEGKDLNRIVDACAIALIVLAVYAGVTVGAAMAIFAVLEWLPVVLFPLMAIQFYSNYERLPLTALSMQLRRAANSERTIDIAYPYFLVCLISASTGNQSATLFFAIVVALWAWVLWQYRRPRGAAVIWVLLITVAAAGGYVMQAGLQQTQLYIEEHAPEWLLAWLDGNPDPYERTTAMGSIGRLKASARIVLRVEAQGHVPRLLRTASYNMFGADTWFARTGGFLPVRREQGTSWQLGPSTSGGATIHITQSAGSDKRMLSLPLGAWRLDGIPAERVERNPMGAVKVLEAPAYLRFSVSFDEATEVDNWPTTTDLRVPDEYEAALTRIAEELELERRSAPDVLRRYFAGEFAYSLDLKALDNSLPPLLDFLTNTRSGHCEYFATATVLLLRKAGIPARYAAGFAVQEFSALENKYLVRRRHAHSWALAFIDGRWQNVDTTPPVWGEVDAANAPMLAGLYDIASWIWLQINRWRMPDEQGDGHNKLVWLLAPLFALLAWRLRLYKRVRLRGRRRAPATTRAVSGSDSECYDIVELFRERGLQRAPGETLASWFDRVAGRDNAQRKDLLADIVRLHYRYRFDPRSISVDERVRLRALVGEWLSDASAAAQETS